MFLFSEKGAIKPDVQHGFQKGSASCKHPIITALLPNWEEIGLLRFFRIFWKSYGERVGGAITKESEGTVLTVLLVGCLTSAPLFKTFDVAFVCRTLLLFGSTLLDEGVGFLPVSWQGGDVPLLVEVPSCPDIYALGPVKDVLGRQTVGP